MDELIERCYEMGWTDGLPVVPPTSQRVNTMLGGLDRDEVVAVLDPGRGVATYEKIAANAVMAGCLPEFFPVVCAAVRAVAQPAFGLDGVLTTIHSQSPLIIVNGPLAESLGFNSGSNALGSGNRANATVGRALLLVLRNVGGARAGSLDPATIGHPGKYSYCFAEFESVSPWQPLHVERGFPAASSTVTLFAADAPLCLARLGAEDGESILATIADALPIAGTYTMAFGGEVLIVMSPEHAALCADHGFTKQKVREYLFEHGRKPASALLNVGPAGYGETAPRWGVAPDPGTLVGAVRDPGRISIVVAGGEIGGYSSVVFCSGRSVSEEISAK